MCRFFGFVLLLNVLSKGTTELRSISPEAVQQEFGQFHSCNGKKIYLNNKEMTRIIGFSTQCVLELPLFGIELSKACVGLCVADKLGYLHSNRSYNYESAMKPLMDTIDSNDPTQQSNKKEVVEMAGAILKKCGEGNGPYIMKDDCKEAKNFDKCLRKTVSEDCGLKL